MAGTFPNRGKHGHILSAPNGAKRRGGSGGVVRGVVGLIKWHYFTAAAVNGYTVTRSRTDVWSLRCNVVNADAFKMSQRPLRFVAPHEKGEWVWMIESLELRDGTCTASLSAPLP
jgi:hypothetical protein